jgi:hypothetical protein
MNNEEKNKEIRQRALALYTPPFTFYCGYIKDSAGNTVADEHDVTGMIAARIRGWGRISYLPSAEQLQDAVGEMVAEALTDYWEKNK